MNARVTQLEAPCDATALDLKDRIIQRTGLTYYQANDRQFWSAVQRRLEAIGFTSTSAYLDQLATEGDDGDEYERLIEELTIGETYFFRHRELFDALRTTIIPDIIKRNHSARRMNIWSAGCSNGAEAYSIAILLHQHFSAQLEGWDVAILGTDLNQQFVAQARAAEYQPWTLRGMTSEMRDACFCKQGNRYRLLPKLKAFVSFEQHNLMSDAEPSLVQRTAPLDLVICRNVMIYFDRTTGLRLLRRFEDSLIQGGWLLLGASESFVGDLGSLQSLQLEGAVVYRKGGAKEVVSDSVQAAGAWCPAISPFLSRFPPMPKPVSMPREASAGPVASNPPHPVPNVAAAMLKTAPFEAPATTCADEILSDNELAELWGLVNCGAFASAAEICTEKMDRCKLDPRLHVIHGLVHEQHGDLNAAEDAFRRAIYLDRDSLYAHYALAMVQLRQGRDSDAQRSLLNGLVATGRHDETGQVPMIEALTIGDLRDLILLHLREAKGL